MDETSREEIERMDREYLRIQREKSGPQRTFTAEDVKAILDQIGKILDIHSAIIDAIIPGKMVTSSDSFLKTPLKDDNMTPIRSTQLRGEDLIFI